MNSFCLEIITFFSKKNAVLKSKATDLSTAFSFVERAETLRFYAAATKRNKKPNASCMSAAFVRPTFRLEKTNFRPRFLFMLGLFLLHVESFEFYIFTKKSCKVESAKCSTVRFHIELWLKSAFAIIFPKTYPLKLQHFPSTTVLVLENHACWISNNFDEKLIVDICISPKIRMTGYSTIHTYQRGARGNVLKGDSAFILTSYYIKLRISNVCTNHITVAPGMCYILTHELCC